MQVAEIAGKKKGHDRTPAARHKFVAAGDAILDQAHIARLLAIGDDVVPRFQVTGADRQTFQERDIIPCQVAAIRSLRASGDKDVLALE